MINTLTFAYKGIGQIVMNNPQCVDPLNTFSKELQKVHKKKHKTEEDTLHKYDLEMAAKIYWQDRLVIPTTWVTASLCRVGYKMARISAADIRSAFFPCEDFSSLEYDGKDQVKEPADIIKNKKFMWLFPTKQGRVKVMKAFPMFHNWSFEVPIEFDDSIIDNETLVRLAKHAARYHGFGDFRPTYGRCELEVT